jgi:predicted metal-dependent hydrolase
MRVKGLAQISCLRSCVLIFREDGTIQYTLKRSKRAKHVRLHVTRTKGLEIVVPHSFNKAWLPSILEKRADWIRNAAKRLRVPTVGEPLERIPNEIFLTALNSTYTVKYVTDERINKRVVDAQKIIRTATGLLSVEFGGQILLPEDTCEADCIELLRLWLIRSGREYLPEFLEEVAAQVGIEFKKVQIRLQKGRWGSCSTRGTISLNARLLLLPQHLLQYILLHELAHVRHPNHSQAYWNFLQTLDPNALQHDAEMRDAWQHIPLCFSM